MLVSVIMPLYNEEKYLDACLQSLLLQTLARNKMEWIFVDGASTDHTKELLAAYQKQFPNLILILDNPKRFAPSALNVGILAARGRYIIRLDAHSCYAKDYLEQCVCILEKTGAQNVGGLCTPKSHTFLGQVMSRMTDCPFGVGNSVFRIGGADGEVDTVPFGAFRRDVFEALGGFDERLHRDEDNEINYRIRKNGGRVYFSSAIRVEYYSRDTVGGMMKFAWQNGFWNVLTGSLCPGSLRMRHFVPFFFVMSLWLLPVASLLFAPFLWLFGVELALYFLLDAFFSVKIAFQESFSYAPLLFLFFPMFHISYGAGSLGAFLRLPFWRAKPENKNDDAVQAVKRGLLRQKEQNAGKDEPECQN